MSKQDNFPNKNKLLIITVGGSLDPIFQSVNYWRPKQILFVCSEESYKEFHRNMKAQPPRKAGARRLWESYKEFCLNMKEKLGSGADANQSSKAKKNPQKNSKENRQSAAAAKKLSPENFKETARGIFPFVEAHNINLLILDDPEDMSKTLTNIRSKAEPKHKEWINNVKDYISIVDITGGTKCMSASMALAAHKWKKCFFSYVGGKRDKKGLGTVESGSEKIICKHNPWEVLGCQSMEEAVLLFKQYNYRAAYDVLSRAFNNMKSNRETEKLEPTLKEEFCAASEWMKAYQDWDDFRHKTALSSLKKLNNKHLNNLKSVFKNFEIKITFSEPIEYLEKILSDSNEGETKNSLYLIFDLIVNARRKACQGRFDDAVARLYRAIEAMSQYRLQKKYGLNTKEIDQKKLTPKLQKKHKNSDFVKLGLDDSYLFLREKTDPLGKKFKELGLPAGEKPQSKNTGEQTSEKSDSSSPPSKKETGSACSPKNHSPLAKRNKSILAHGFTPLSETDYENLLQPALELFKILEENLKEGKAFDFNKGEGGRVYFPKLKKQKQG